MEKKKLKRQTLELEADKLDSASQDTCKEKERRRKKATHGVLREPPTDQAKRSPQRQSQGGPVLYF
jgi:hypothetical protein